MSKPTGGRCPWWKRHKWSDEEVGDVTVRFNNRYYRDRHPRFNHEKDYEFPGYQRSCLNCGATQIASFPDWRWR